MPKIEMHQKFDLRKNWLRVGKKMTGFSLVIGCGYTSQRSLCRANSIVCLDIDIEKIIIARKKDPFAYYIVCDARALPFREGAFYDVVCTDVLEHIINYEVVLKEIVKLKPKFIYLMFPTEAREKLLISCSKIYREEHWGKIHVRIVDVKEVAKFLLEHGYIVNIELTSASSTLQRIFLQKLLETFDVPYKIPEIGLVEFKATHLLKFLVLLSMVIAQFGSISYFIWKFLRVQTLHDGYIISAVYRCQGPNVSYPHSKQMM